MLLGSHSSGFYGDLGLDEFESVIPQHQSWPTDSRLASPSSLSPGSSTEFDLLPSRLLRNTLIDLYFDHIYSLCPVIDENYFRQLASMHDDLSLFSNFSIGLFHAMMFAASQYVDETTLVAESEFKSLPEAQQFYYNTAKRAYRSEMLQSATSSDELDLASMALLLSYWCPQGTTAGVNSHWIERAISHIKEALRYTTTARSRSTRDVKTIYWSCIVRNTLVSFALRRPARLHPISSGFSNPDDILDNFEQDTKDPGLLKQLYRLNNFIWTCKICKILNVALLTLQQGALIEDWSLPSYQPFDSTDPDEEFRHSSLSVPSLQLLHFKKLELQLVDLGKLYEGKLQLGDISACDTQAQKEKGSGALFMNYMITFSSITALYGYLFEMMPLAGAERLLQMAIHKMDVYSQKAAFVARRVLHSLLPAHIPISMLAWIVIPATVSLVQTPVHESSIRGLEFLDLTKLLSQRSESAVAIGGLLSNINSKITQVSSRDHATVDGGGTPSSKCEKDHSASNEKIDVKSEALRQGLKLLNLDLAHGNPLL